MFKFLRVTRLWILLLPIAIYGVGSVSNQAVLAANHDRFPVMINAHELRELEKEHERSPNAIGDIIGIITGAPAPPPNEPFDGMLDERHCVMTSDTHLNFLADWIDLQVGWFSPGDLLLMLGEYLMDYAPLVWAICMMQLAWTGQLTDPR